MRVDLTHLLLPANFEYPLSESALKAISPAALAYLGDAVFELYIRTQFLLPPCRIRDYHQQVVTCVRAETQAKFMAALLPSLSETEKLVLKQGRNAANRQPKRLSPEIYQQASSLETLIGYLYLSNPSRLEEILSHFSTTLSQSNPECESVC